MLGSQVLEVAIGLAVVFLILALAGSAVTELVSQVMKKRSKDLKKAIGRIVAGQPQDLTPSETDAWNFVETLYNTSPISSLGAAAKGSPSYIAASAFAEGVREVLESDGDSPNQIEAQIELLPEGLKGRADAAYRRAGGNLERVQADLESWFDKSMDRLTGVYKRWTRAVVLVVTIVIVLLANADAVRLATELWESPTLREAVVGTAASITDPADETTTISDAAEEIQSIEALGIPLLWDCPDTGCGGLAEWADRIQAEVPQRFLGWIITILLVSLGAPFWYGALTKLTSLRSAGSKPPPADQDDSSATSLLLRREAAAAASPTLTLDLAALQPDSPTQPAVPVPE